MTEASPFFDGVLSPPGSLKIGAALLSPDETPSLLKSMRAPVMHTPVPPSSSTSLYGSHCTKTRKRDRAAVRIKVHTSSSRARRGKNLRLQPYVVRLLEEVLSKRTTDILNYPLLPDLPHTEPESRRRIRQHLRNRFMPAKGNTDLVHFTQELLDRWGGKIQSPPRDPVILHPSGEWDFSKLITPLRRTRKGPSNPKFEALQEDDLMELDFLDDEAAFADTIKTASTTMEDNWNCSRTNLRRVTYHESPSAVSHTESSTVTAAKLEPEPKAKRAKNHNPKRGMRWTTAERKLFLQGLERWGAGNWKSIHKIIPGRQVA